MNALQALVKVAHAAIALGLIAGTCASAAAQPGPAGPARLRAALQRDLDAYLKERGTAEHLSSLSLTVSLGRSKPSIDLTSGTTRYHAGPRVTTTSLYQIGSNTKAFTAVAVLQLEAQGRLSIDAPIGRYLSQYPAYAKLTLRRLLSMTSGLESYDNVEAWYTRYVKNPLAKESTDALIRLVYPAKKFAPGTKYYYSNTGYLLAQEVVAKVSSTHSFDKELARIIASAGLKNTYYSSDFYPAAIQKRIVSGYYENDDPGFQTFLGRDTSRDSVSWAQGAGSIVSTPADLTTWARVLYQGTVLLPPLQKRELTTLVSTKDARPLRVPVKDDPAGFGLGVAQRFDPKLGSFWFYQGETLGFRAAHLYFPSRDLVVSVFANSRPKETDSKLPALFAAIDKSIRANPI
jgi:D-alanyl-D-alanine carboxypeptidase